MLSPDITGTIYDLATTDGEPRMGYVYGCFENKKQSVNAVKSSSSCNVNSQNGDGIDMKASLSSAVFGKSDTVRMNSLRLLVIVKY